MDKKILNKKDNNHVKLVIQVFLSFSLLFPYVSRFCACPYHFSKLSYYERERGGKALIS